MGRDLEPEAGQATTNTETTSCVYWIYGAKDVVLYVGLTDDLERRLQQHAVKFWWQDVRRIESKAYEGRDTAERAERAQIRRLNPVHNRAHNGVAPARRETPTVTEFVPRRYASVARAAEYVDCGRKTIDRLIAEGRLTGYRLAGRSRILRVDLDELDALMKPIPTVERP